MGFRIARSRRVIAKPNYGITVTVHLI
jgi:hypothetical protein